jgi:hypothetical protein
VTLATGPSSEHFGFPLPVFVPQMILIHIHQSTTDAKLPVSGMFSISDKLATVQI